MTHARLRKAFMVSIFLFTCSILVFPTSPVELSFKSIPSSGTISYPRVHYVVAADGSGDFVDIQEAIDALPSYGGVVFIKRGLYDLNPKLSYPFRQIVLRDNVSLIGEGIDQTIIRMFPELQPVESSVRMDITAVNGYTQNLLIENLTFMQNGTPDNLGSNALSFRGLGYGPFHNLSNIVIRSVKIVNGYGAGIKVAKGTNITIEKCIVETAWTGMVVVDSQQVQIRDNTIVNCTGDGIFPSDTCRYVMIENNRLENIGDTAIDITSRSDLQPNEKIIVRNNYVKNGRHIRITNSKDVQIINNSLENTNIHADSGQGRPINIIISNNYVVTNSRYGIAFLGARDCVASKNFIEMLSPEPNVVQSGIIAAIVGKGLIDNNTVIGAANYGISFAGYGLGSSTNLTITRNKLINFDDIGIWDDGKKQGGTVYIEDNILWDQRNPFVSKYGIRTDCESNKFMIAYNIIYAGIVDYVSAPNSQLIDNIFEPP